MKFRYLFGIFVGAIIITAILLFGEKGVVALALLTLRPMVMRWKKMKADEREISLFHKTNTVTFGILLATIIIFYMIIGKNISDYLTVQWLGIFVSTILLIQSFVGFLFLKFK